jgi:hypothetical protein
VVITTISSVGLNAFAWGMSTHKSLVNTQASRYFVKDGIDYQSVTADAAYYTDSESYMDASSIRKVGTAYIISPYHAKANLSCTTVQATSYTSASSQGYSFSDVRSAASFLYGLAQTGINGNTINLNQSTSRTNVQNRIVADLQDLITNKFSGTTSNYKRGYIIFGVYLHLIQDITAHRAVVTADRIKTMYANNSSYFSDYSGALAAANKYSGIPMIRLKDYLVGNSNSYYEDNADYWTERYTAAYTLTSNQVEYIYKGDSFSLIIYYIDVK